MIRSANLTSIDRDEPLELLADDRLLAGSMTEACHALGPLLTVEPVLLAPDDRAALVTHLTACARCRAVGVDVWLDGVVPPPETVVIARLPPVRQLARTSSRRRRWMAASALAACLSGGAVVATQLRESPATAPLTTPSSGAPVDARPWARGVSEAAQQAALARFTEGNTLLLAGKMADAAARYRDALTHWDHPAIAFNLAVALIDLDAPVEQQRALVKALRFGVAPLDPEKFARAQAMLVEVNARLARE